MAPLQLRIDENLKKAIKEKADRYGVPASSLIRIVLVKAFLDEDEDIKPGNIFNADRDNKGNGINIDALIAAL